VIVGAATGAIVGAVIVGAVIVGVVIVGGVRIVRIIYIR